MDIPGIPVTQVRQLNTILCPENSHRKCQKMCTQQDFAHPGLPWCQRAPLDALHISRFIFGTSLVSVGVACLGELHLVAVAREVQGGTKTKLSCSLSTSVPTLIPCLVPRAVFCVTALRVTAAGEAQPCGRGRSHLLCAQVSRPPARGSRVQEACELQRGS